MLVLVLHPRRTLFRELLSQRLNSDVHNVQRRFRDIHHRTPCLRAHIPKSRAVLLPFLVPLGL